MQRDTSEPGSKITNYIFIISSRQWTLLIDLCSSYILGGELHERVRDCRATYRKDQRQDVLSVECDWQTEKRTYRRGSRRSTVHESQTLFSVRKTLDWRQKCQRIINAWNQLPDDTI